MGKPAVPLGLILYRQSLKRLGSEDAEDVFLQMQVQKRPLKNRKEQKDGMSASGVFSDQLSCSGGKIYGVLKSCFDFVFSLGMGVVLLVPLAVLAVIVACKDPGNPFFFQKRVGKDGKTLYMAKLRSMKMGADQLDEMLTPQQLEEYRREYKLSDDPRLIGYRRSGDGKKCFGGFIRRSSLDEVPQIIWNILIRRDMSVVGPRPILRQELEENYTPEEQTVLLSIKPGLTGYWQAYARNEASYKTGERQRMELFYVRNRSVWFDVKILFSTVYAVLRKQGAK